MDKNKIHKCKKTSCFTSSLCSVHCIVIHTRPNYFLLTQTTEPKQKFATNNVMSFFKKTKKQSCFEEGNKKNNNKFVDEEGSLRTKIILRHFLTLHGLT